MSHLTLQSDLSNRPRTLHLFLLILVSGLSNLHAQPNGTDQELHFVTPATGGKFIEWYGISGRTYFLQTSDPTDHINKWKWFPIIERGNNESISHEVDGIADKAFFRLQYTDQTAADLDNADFDGDGLSNIEEITPFILPGGRAARGIGGGSSSASSTTNPLDSDTDHDGTNDGDERGNGSDPKNPDSGGTPKGSDAAGTGGGGGTPSDVKLVYRGVINSQLTWYRTYQPTVELFSSSLLTHFAANISTDVAAIKVDLHYAGDADDETVNLHAENESSTADYTKIGTQSLYGSPPAGEPNPFTDTDASAELFALFADITPAVGDDFSTWKKFEDTSLPLGDSDLATDNGRNYLWTTRKSTAKYQFGVTADEISNDARYAKWDFLQVRTISNEYTSTPIYELAEPPLVTKSFTIPVGAKHSFWESIVTPETQITPETAIAKSLNLVPIQIGDNTPATGVDAVSRNTAESDLGYQANYWIMAPAGNVPNIGGPCNNALQFKIPLPTGTRLKMSCPNATPSPATISPHIGSEPTVVWHGTANASGDQTPIFKLGTEESEVALPIRVKVMKNRKVKVKVHIVSQARVDPETNASYTVDCTPEMLPTKNELEAYLNSLFAYQINTWFDVTVVSTPLVVPFTNAISFGSINPTADQNLITGSIEGSLLESHINVFIIGKNGTLDGGYGVTNTSQATCWILGKSINQYVTKQRLLETIGHEMGHVFFGDGHPNGNITARGRAPLTGTDHTKRLMCIGEASSSESRLIVKSEWDAAEDWLNEAEITLPMTP